MGQQLTKEEETILSTWKALLKRKGVKTSEQSLKKILIWSKMQGFEATTVTAFSVSAWQAVGLKILDEVSKGQKEACELATTWRLLSKTLKEWKAECEVNDEQKRDEKPENVGKGRDCDQGANEADASASVIAGRKPLTGKIRSRPRPPPPPPPLNILRGDEGPPPPSGAAAAPSGAAAEGVIPSPPPPRGGKYGE